MKTVNIAPENEYPDLLATQNITVDFKILKLLAPRKAVLLLKSGQSGWCLGDHFFEERGRHDTSELTTYI